MWNKSCTFAFTIKAIGIYVSDSSYIKRSKTIGASQLHPSYGAGYTASQLTRLNRELDRLYELIYEAWDTITEQDYVVFGGQLSLLVSTVKLLYDDCRRSSFRNLMHDEVDSLV